jgi:HK97 family phage major capsid protein
MIEKLKLMQDSIKELNETNESLKGQLDTSKEEFAKNLEDTVAELKKDLEESLAERKSVDEDSKEVSKDELKDAEKGLSDLYLKSAMSGKAIKDMDEYKGFMDTIEKALKPDDVADWLDTKFANTVKERMELELKVATVFDKVVVPRNAHTLTVPVRTGDLKAYLIQPAADAIESIVTAGKVVIHPEKMKVLTAVADPESLDEVAVSVLDLTKTEMARSLARGLESLIIQGDTAIADANDLRKINDGLLKLGKANAVDGAGAPVTVAGINAARASMGVLGVNPRDLTMIVSPKVFIGLATLPEFLTADKFGNQFSSNHTGIVGKILGINVVVSEFVPEDLAADGTNDNSGTTSAAIIVHNNSFIIGEKEDAMLNQSDKNIVSDVLLLTASYRVQFVSVASANEKAVVAITNLV